MSTILSDLMNMEYAFQVNNSVELNTDRCSCWLTEDDFIEEEDDEVGIEDSMFFYADMNTFLWSKISSVEQFDIEG